MFAKFRHSHTDRENIVVKERKTRSGTNLKTIKAEIQKAWLALRDSKSFLQSCRQFLFKSTNLLRHNSRVLIYANTKHKP